MRILILSVCECPYTHVVEGLDGALLEERAVVDGHDVRLERLELVAVFKTPRDAACETKASFLHHTWCRKAIGP